MSRKPHLRGLPISASGQVDMNMWCTVPAWHYRISTGPDSLESVTSFCVGDCDAIALEVRIERRRISIRGVAVASGGIRLPDLHLDPFDRFAFDIEHLPHQVEPLALGAVIGPFAP